MADRISIKAFRWILEIFNVADRMDRKRPEYYCIYLPDMAFYLNKKVIADKGAVEGSIYVREVRALLTVMTYSDHKNPTLN